MKCKSLFFVLTIIVFSCARSNTLQHDKIVAVRPAFKDTSFTHWDGYRVGQEIVKYDQYNIGIKEFLSRNVDRRNTFATDPDLQRIYSLLHGKRIHKF